ncbi:MAG TPA: Gfo/Idh/MocA family oxidoreductase [Acidimicrobiales bacterium]|nr:Gfo/Idh/MocA family oxidoreductase [Acidimicrobiales bacterium]
MTPPTVRVAVVGLIQGLEDVYITLNHPRFELRAVCDVDTAKYDFITGKARLEDSGHELAASPVHAGLIAQIRQHPDAAAIELEADYEALLSRDDLDAVILVVPDLLHEEFTVQGLEAGKHVLCTKPMALTMDSALRIGEVARAHPGRYMLGFQISYSPFAKAVLEVIDSGAVGTPRHIRFDYDRWPWRPSHSRKHAAVDGAIIKESVHWLDLIYRLNGRLPFRAVAGFGGLDLLTEQLDFEDNGVLIIDYPGFRALHSFSYFRKGRQIEDFLLVGELGTLRGTFSELVLENDAEERHIVVPGHSMPYEHHRGYVEMLDELAAVVLDGREAYSGWQTALENMLTSYAAQLAVAEGRTVERAELASMDWRLRVGAPA